jgi:hypothetical protein
MSPETARRYRGCRIINSGVCDWLVSTVLLVRCHMVPWRWSRGDAAFVIALSLSFGSSCHQMWCQTKSLATFIFSGFAGK